MPITKFREFALARYSAYGQPSAVKGWPGFNDEGDMPPGLHQAALAEVVKYFGHGTPERQRVSRRLEHIYGLAKATGHLARFIIFGSFVTAKLAPKDVDIFLLMDDDFDVSRLPNEIRILFDHTAAQNRLGASVFWIRRAAAIGGEQAAVGYWQITRSGGQRGIVEVIKDDPQR